MTAPDSVAIAQISRARQYLADAKGLEDIKAVRDMAEAARLYARARDLGLEAMNEAAEIKVLAECAAGEVLAAMKKQAGARTPTGSREGTPLLSDAGVSKKQSSDWQAMASLPKEDVQEIIASAKEKGEPVTTKKVVTEAKKRKQAKSKESAKKSNGPEPGSPVNAQRIRDAHLRRDFQDCMTSLVQILTYSPDRVAEVLEVERAASYADSFDRLSAWADAFRVARSGGLRVVGEN